MSTPSRLAQARSVAIVSSGNFLEMYDFTVFGYFAPAIAKAFFPAGSEFASLMLTLMTFGAGFLMRPVGALVLGAYVDRHGRRKGLMLTLGLMALGTLAIAAMPTFQTIGLAAPILVVVCRLIQGLSAGVEVGGVAVYLAEIAPPGRRGFFVAWQSASQQVAVVFAALIGLAGNLWLGARAMDAWGWRLPFVVGGLLIPVLVIIRRSLQESPAFLSRRETPTVGAILMTLRSHWGLVARGAMMAVTTTVFFYMITAYTPTFGTKVLHLSKMDSLLVTLAVGLTNFFVLPLVGALSDRTGRRPILIAMSLLGLATGYLGMRWLVAAPDFGRLIMVDLLFAVIYASYNAAMVVFLTEAMPASARASGFSLTYGLAAGLFGGFTPAIGSWLIHLTGDRAAPGLWLMTAAGIGLASVLSFARHGRAQLHLRALGERVDRA